MVNGTSVTAGSASARGIHDDTDHRVAVRRDVRRCPSGWAVFRGIGRVRYRRFVQVRSQPEEGVEATKGIQFGHVIVSTNMLISHENLRNSAAPAASHHFAHQRRIGVDTQFVPGYALVVYMMTSGIASSSLVGIFAES